MHPNTWFNVHLECSHNCKHTSYYTVSLIGWIKGTNISWHTGQSLFRGECLFIMDLDSKISTLTSHPLILPQCTSVSHQSRTIWWTTGHYARLFWASLWAVFHGKTVQRYMLWNSLTTLLLELDSSRIVGNVWAVRGAEALFIVLKLVALSITNLQ